jgi:hypothetical protein
LRSDLRNSFMLAHALLVHDDEVCGAAEELNELQGLLLQAAAEHHGAGCCVCDAEEDPDAAPVEAVAGLTPVLVVGSCFICVI